MFGLSKKNQKPFLDDNGFDKLHVLNDISDNHHNILTSNDIISDSSRIELLKKLKQQHIVSFKTILNKNDVKCYQLRLTKLGIKEQADLKAKADKQNSYDKRYVKAFKVDSLYGYLVAIIGGIFLVIGAFNSGNMYWHYSSELALACFVVIFVFCPIAFETIKNLIHHHYDVHSRSMVNNRFYTKYIIGD